MFAPSELIGRRPDQPGVALYLDRQGVQVDAKSSFVAKVGKRFQSGALVRLNVLFTPVGSHVPVAIQLSFADKVGRLAVSEDGTWTVDSEDSDGPIPVAHSPLLADTSYAISLCVDAASGLYRDVIVDGKRISPQVVDLVPGPVPVEESYLVDVMQGGAPDPNMPHWVAAKIATFSAEQLLEQARQNGGRLTVSHLPDQAFEEVPRPAPLVTLEGENPPVFSFSVESSGPIRVERIWAIEV